MPCGCEQDLWSNVAVRSANGRNRVRREHGKELVVQVHYGEGVAIHTGPESCAGGREAVREALTGERAGQPLSHEKADIPGADAVRYAEGHTKGRAIASSPTTRRGRRPWHVQTLFVREPGGLEVDQGGTPPLVRIGKARSRSRGRSGWGEGREPMETRASKARPGRRTGKACHRRWSAYGKPQSKGGRSGSPRSSTTSTPQCCVPRSSR